MKVVSVILNIFAVMTAFFGVYLGFREATQGIVMNILRRKMPAEKINENLVQRGIMIFAILLAWSAIVLNAPVLSFTSICSLDLKITQEEIRQFLKECPEQKMW